MTLERPSRSLLLTFDYELFLGRRSGSAERCLLTPTAEILGLLVKHRCKAIFFVDCTYLLRLIDVAAEHPRAAADLERIQQQLRQAGAAGHELFYHMHPHWLDARYLPTTNEWDLSEAARFCLSGVEEREKGTLFARSKELIEGLLGDSGQPRRPSGFRAGGLAVQPFEAIRTHLQSVNVRFDFSVLKGFFGEGPGFRVDFRSAPATEVYPFTDDVLRRDAEGEFTEYSLTGMHVGGWARVLNGVVYRIVTRLPCSRRWGDGESSGKSLQGSTGPLAAVETCSLELLNPVKLRLYLSYLETHDYMHTISHPKLCSPMNLRCFDAFLKTAASRFRLETDFRNFAVGRA